MSTSDCDESFITASGNDSFSSATDDSGLDSLSSLLTTAFHPFSKNFNVCHCNAQSIPAHHSDLIDSFNIPDLHALLISESWLKPSLPSTSFSIPGYILIRNDRTGKRGGGVAIYLKSHIPFKIVLQSPPSFSDSSEFLFIELDLGIKVVLGVVYCPPNIDYFNSLELALENLMATNTHFLLMGDLNTCLMKDNSRSQKLRLIIDSVNLTILDLLPTHHSSTTDTLLDLIFTCNPDLIHSFGQLSAPAFSLHDVIYSSFKIKPPKPKPMTLLLRSFRRVDEDRLREDADSVDWSTIESLTSIDDKVNFLCNNVINIFDRHAPLKPVKLKRPPAPWLTDTIRRFMRKRDRAFRRYKASRSEENWSVFKTSRNRCNQLCRNAKRRYIAEQLDLETPAGKWRFLRTLGVGKSKNQNTKIPIDPNDLNRYFTNTPKLPPSTKSKTLLDIRSLPIANVDQFSFSPVTCTEVRKIILSTTTRAVGCDGIGRTMILHILDLILPAIVHIINYSLSSGQFPDLWRIAYVVPLPKVNNPSTCSQFRPISILPFLSKALESCVYHQLSSFLRRSGLINPYQSGFKTGHSTTTALLNITEDIRSGMEEGMVTLLVLVDFSNAFNVVDHDLLIAAIERLNIDPLVVQWFASFLIQRRQAIRIGGDLSDWCPLTTGVPQGGILSPILFSLFIDLLTTRFQCHYHLYADDLQLYQQVTVSELAAGIANINAELARLLDWSKAYGITVNPNKCQAIVVGSPRQTSVVDYDSLKIYYDGCTIPLTTTVTNLGIVFDDKLNWKPQVVTISRRLFASFHSLMRLKNFLPISTKKLLASSLLLPFLDYADTCYIDLTEELLNKLERLQNNCIRFIFNLRKFDHVSAYRKKLGWLPIRQRRNLRTVCLLFNILFDPNTPIYLKSRFNFLSDTHALSLRSSNNLVLSTPSHHTTFLDKSFSVQAVRLWNALPLCIRKAQTRQSFKHLVRQHYLKES